MVTQSEVGSGTSVDLEVGEVYPCCTGVFKCSCGAELPVSAESVEFARQHKFYKLDGAFNGFFYELLRQSGAWTGRSKGLDRNEVHDLLRLLSKHRRCLGFVSRGQVRGLLGREYGLFDDTGRLRTERINRAGMRAQDRRKKDSALPKLRHQEEEAFSLPEEKPCTETSRAYATRRLRPELWDSVVDEALLACSDLKDQGGIQSELRWVNSNMFEWPDFKSSPSRTAVKWWLALNNPSGVEPAMREMLKMMWSKRLSPGDTGSRKKKSASAFEEDADTVESDDHDAESYRRLFGDEESFDG